MDLFSFLRGEQKSKTIAKNRLKLILVHDKGGGYSTQVLEKLKIEILAVITKYLEVDEEQVEIKMIKMKKNEENETETALVANVPIKRMK